MAASLFPASASQEPRGARLSEATLRVLTLNLRTVSNGIRILGVGNPEPVVRYQGGVVVRQMARVHGVEDCSRAHPRGPNHQATPHFLATAEDDPI